MGRVRTTGILQSEQMGRVRTTWLLQSEHMDRIVQSEHMGRVRTIGSLQSEHISRVRTIGLLFFKDTQLVNFDKRGLKQPIGKRDSRML